MKCLPSDAYKVENNKLLLARDLRVGDFCRVRHYASYIRVLGTDRVPHNDTLLDPFLSVLWSRNPEKKAILPNLHTFTVSADEFGGLAIYPRLVIGPFLQNICLYAKDSFKRLDSRIWPWPNIIASLRVAKGSLSSFSIGFGIPYCHVVLTLAGTSSVLSLLANLSCLSNLGIESLPLSGKDLFVLSRLDTICDISITITDLDMLLPSRSNLDSNTEYFPNLRSLNVAARKPQFEVELLSCIGCTQLKFLAVTSIGDNTWHSRQLFKMLGTSPTFTRLESLAVEDAFSMDDPISNHEQPSQSEHPFTLTVRAIAPLFSLKFLTSLIIDQDTSETLNDDCLNRMFDSWPSLEVLELQDMTGCDGFAPCLTLSSLISATLQIIANVGYMF